MSKRTLPALFAACTLAAALLLGLPSPVQAAPRTTTLDGWPVALKWIWKIWGGGTEKSGVHIDPNGKPASNGTSSNGTPNPEAAGAGTPGSGGNGNASNG